MLARSRGVPMIVGLGARRPRRPRGRDRRRLFRPRHPLAPRRALVGLRGGPRGGGRPCQRRGRGRASARRAPATAFRSSVMINVAEPEELDRLDPAICDGIGLVRTEFLFHNGGHPGRGDAVPRLSPHRRMGGAEAGGAPHARRRRRQADSRTHHRRRVQPVPRHPRHPPLPRPAGRLPRPAPRAWPAPPSTATRRSCCRW